MGTVKVLRFLSSDMADLHPENLVSFHTGYCALMPASCVARSYVAPRRKHRPQALQSIGEIVQVPGGGTFPHGHPPGVQGGTSRVTWLGTTVIGSSKGAHPHRHSIHMGACFQVSHLTPAHTKC